VITQNEAGHLLQIPKKRINNDRHQFPLGGAAISLPILSTDDREQFLIDINRGSIALKCTYQNRYQKTVVLVRVDLNGPPHTNPDVSEAPLPILRSHVGKTLPGKHLHLYVEGYMDKWAIPLPESKFTNQNDIFESLNDFFSYCNVVEPPIVQKGLF